MRWVVVVALSLLIHLALIDALPHWAVEPADDDTLGEPLHATLAPLVQPAPIPAPAPPPEASRPAPSRPPPEPRTTSRGKRVAVVEEPFVPDSFEPPQPVEVKPATPAVAAPPAAPRVDTAARCAACPIAAAVADDATAVGAARLRGRLAEREGNQSDLRPRHHHVGHGRRPLRDRPEGGRQRVPVQARRAVVAQRRDDRPGRAAAGPLPRVAAAGGATVSTNFNRDERQSVTFSASAASVPLPAGAQDRLSVLFQIGALLLADPSKTTAGTTFDIPVAGVRGDVETWRFDSLGPETLDTGVGTLSTTHLRRAPRPGTNDRTIDVWVAQADGGYPARVLYTEPSGNTVTMTLDRISAMPP